MKPHLYLVAVDNANHDTRLSSIYFRVYKDADGMELDCAEARNMGENLRTFPSTWWAVRGSEGEVSIDGDLPEMERLALADMAIKEAKDEGLDFAIGDAECRTLVLRGSADRMADVWSEDAGDREYEGNGDVPAKSVQGSCTSNNHVVDKLKRYDFSRVVDESLHLRGTMNALEELGAHVVFVDKPGGPLAFPVSDVLEVLKALDVLYADRWDKASTERMERAKEDLKLV